MANNIIDRRNYISDETINKNYIKYMELLKSIDLEGIDDLIKWLETTDIKTAPASSKYHSNFYGGLIAHCLCVYKVLKAKLKMISKITIDESTILISSLLHDVCKLNFYKDGSVNRKGKDGQWYSCKTFEIDTNSDHILGHGEESVIMLKDFIKLTREQEAIIRWHMGQPSNDYIQEKTFNRAIDKYPSVLAFHLSDYEASKFLEIAINLDNPDLK